MEASFERKITSEMMSAFLEITGDSNPLHNSREYANQKGYADRVVYGMLTASFISTLGGVYLPGKYCLIQGVETKFLKPVYIGDHLTIRGKIIELHESVRQVVIRFAIKNQREEKVCRGILKAGVQDE